MSGIKLSIYEDDKSGNEAYSHTHAHTNEMTHNKAPQTDEQNESIGSLPLSRSLRMKFVHSFGSFILVLNLGPLQPKKKHSQSLPLAQGSCRQANIISLLILYYYYHHYDCCYSFLSIYKWITIMKCN